MKYHTEPEPKVLAFDLGYHVQMSQIDGWNNRRESMSSRETTIHNLFEQAKGMGIWDGDTWSMPALEEEYIRGKNYARRIANSD